MCILQETIKIVGAKNYFSQENLTTFNKEKNTIFAGKRSRVWEKTALEVRDRCRHALLRARRASSAAPLCSRDRSQTSYFFKVCKNNEQRRIMPPFWGWCIATSEVDAHLAHRRACPIGQKMSICNHLSRAFSKSVKKRAKTTGRHQIE